MPLTLKNFNKKPRTFTISWTEASDPTQFNPVYSDAATGLTAGDTAFDDFFGYSAVLLNTSGVETAEMKQSGGVFTGAMSTLGNITSGDNVMIKFPVRGIKMTKSSSTVTLSITDGLGREAEGFQYYAFQNTGDIEANASTTVATKPFYLGAYLGYNNSNVIKSWSGKTPTANLRIAEAISYSGANGTGYTIMGYYQRMYVNALYMMKYGNPNSKTVIGQGYVGGSGKTAAGGTNSQTSATYGTTSNTTQVKLFGLEDRWGNAMVWLGGCLMYSGYLYTALHNFTALASTSQAQYKQAGSLPQNGSYYNIGTVYGDNKIMLARSWQFNSNYNTYYCSWGQRATSDYRFGHCSSAYNYSNVNGIFNLWFTQTNSAYDGTIVSRLMYL